LLVQDDRRGPYREVWVHKLVEEVESESSLAVVIPLPAGLWLSGSAAEFNGADILARACRSRLEDLASWSSGRIPDAAVGAHRSALQHMVDNTRGDRSGDLAIRTYAATGRDFKHGFVERVPDSRAARVVAYTSLPKYVWVVEAVDRRVRPKSNRQVVATVVLDASAVSDGSREGLTPLIVYVPGQIARVTPDPYSDENWEPTPLAPYMSGRWTHAKPWLLSPGVVAARAKGAVPGG